MPQNRDPHEIAARIIHGLTEPSKTFVHNGLIHSVEEYLRLPAEFHDRNTRLAPIQIIARAGELGVHTTVYSGQWERFVTHERGYGIIQNPGPKENVYYTPIGTLRCTGVEVELAPTVAAAWLTTICSIVQERSPTEEELAVLSARRIQAKQMGFYHARSLTVRPKWRLFGKRQ